MSIGVIGRKVGMTRIFFENGESVPVTVVEVKDNRVAHHKTVEKDGYSAIQVAFGEKKDKRLSKPLIGHYAKAGVKPGRFYASSVYLQKNLENFLFNRLFQQKRLPLVKKLT